MEICKWRKYVIQTLHSCKFDTAMQNAYLDLFWVCQSESLKGYWIEDCCDVHLLFDQTSSAWFYCLSWLSKSTWNHHKNYPEISPVLSFQIKTESTRVSYINRFLRGFWWSMIMSVLASFTRPMMKLRVLLNNFNSIWFASYQWTKIN